MIDDEIEEAINDQINAELYSAYIYLSMAADLGERGLDGFETWMHSQFIEETNHAMRLYQYLESRGGRVKLEEIEKPKIEWDSPLEIFKDAYEHEQYVTGRINDLADLAEEKNDRATLQMLQWFIDEQVEEEESAEEIVDKLEMIGDDSRGLMMLDKDLGQRPMASVFPVKAEEGEEE
ncbi:MAG: ferritin [Candidatus Thermoplasmatota archaeon]|nr:ferritin [Candidatus Thermoplasmatota archaeon]MBS3790880.1 ferritin [Candidatus Thermoplasmatota archaeon]